MTEPINWAEVDDYLAEVDKDGRIGNHVLEVTDFEDMGESKFGEGHWYDLKGTLTTAGDAKASCNFSDFKIRSKEELAELSLPARRSESLNIRLQKQLNDHYGTGLEDFKKNKPIGLKLGVTTNKDKNGFIRIYAFLPLSEVTSAQEETEVKF